jgi:hypothetical protein
MEEVTNSIVIGGAVEDDADVVILNEAAGTPDLPAGATFLPDGSVRYTLSFPIAIRTRASVGAAVTNESFSELVFRRLKGPDMRKIMVAKGRMTIVALTRSCGLSAARAAVLYDRMDAKDISAASDVVAILGGFNEMDGLPTHAEVTDEGKIILPLLHPESGGEFELPEKFVMRRMTGADLIAISQGGAKGAEMTINALARTTGITLKDASDTFDAMDAEDIMALQRTVGFLSGNGQKTGR